MLIVAASTQRTIGLIVLVAVFLGFAVYVFANIRAGRREVGSEVELAPNRKPYLSDEELESSKLDRTLLFALGMLVIIAVGLPLYWLGEPGRHEGAEEHFLEKSIRRGAASYEERCSACHGPGGVGGVASTSLTDPETDQFVAQISWQAPSLTSVFSRFADEDIRQILDFGRVGVMPAWGEPGGGPLGRGQIDDLMNYMRSIQISPEALREEVDRGIRDDARPIMLAENPDLVEAREEAEAIDDEAERAEAVAAADAAIEERLDEFMAEISDPRSPRFASVYGRLVFNNSAGGGAFNCASCHTKGWSYDGTEVISLVTGRPVVEELIDGGGFFGPNLTGGVTVRQFPTVEGHEDFVRNGSVLGELYGEAGQGTGRMPGFGSREDPDRGLTFGATLTDNQIAAVVAYERSL